MNEQKMLSKLEINYIRNKTAAEAVQELEAVEQIVPCIEDKVYEYNVSFRSLSSWLATLKSDGYIPKDLFVTFLTLVNFRHLVGPFKDQKIGFLNPEFMELWLDNMVDGEKLAWTFNFLSDYKKIFIPILRFEDRFRDGRWILSVIDQESGNIYFHNSRAEPFGCEMMFQKLVSLLKKHHKSLGGSTTFDRNRWKLIDLSPPVSGLSWTDKPNTGVYALMCANFLSQNMSVEPLQAQVFTTDEMRIFIRRALIGGHLETAITKQSLDEQHAQENLHQQHQQLFQQQQLKLQQQQQQQKEQLQQQQQQQQQKEQLQQQQQQQQQQQLQQQQQQQQQQQLRMQQEQLQQQRIQQEQLQQKQQQQQQLQLQLQLQLQKEQLQQHNNNNNNNNEDGDQMDVATSILNLGLIK